MLKRSITGLILGLVMISGLLYSSWSACLILLIILVFSSQEWIRHFVVKSGRGPVMIFTSFALVCLSLLLAPFFYPGLNYPKESLHSFNLILLLVFLVFGWTVYFRKEWPIATQWFSGIFYILFSLLVTGLFLFDEFERHKWIVMGLVAINWSNDTFAYFTGRLIGKNLLAPDISPKKTIEGALGGLVAACLAAWLVNHYLFVDSYTLPRILTLGFFVWIAGTTGDLYESKLKRMAGIKDSGQLLPGHGGFLDRFDSFFFIVPTGIFVLTY